MGFGERDYSSSSIQANLTLSPSNNLSEEWVKHEKYNSQNIQNK